MLFLKRLIIFVIALGVIVFAITFSGLNTDKITLNFYFFNYEFSIGFAIILSVFTGLLIGLLMSLFGFYMPLKSKINKLNRKNRELTREKLNHSQLEHNND